MNENLKQAYLDKAAAQLQEWSAKMEVVKAKVAKETANIRVGYHTQLAAWQEKESDFQRKISDLRNASESGFESMKAGVQNVWNELGAMINTLEENKNEKK